MIPPASSSFVQSGDLYPVSSTSHGSGANASNYGSTSSAVGSSAQGQGSSYPALYNMGASSYEYGFGYLPHSYPFNPSSSV
jgi:hypothetical protein